MSSFDNRVAVVTGAAGDMGVAVSRRLVQMGARVWATDIRRMDGLEDEIRSGRVIARRFDVTQSVAVDQFFAEVAATDGPATLLANIAGGPGVDRVPIEAVSDDAWHRVVALNLDSVFYCARAAGRHMKSANLAGAIVVVSSGAGRTYSRTGVQAYTAAKAGAIGLTRQLARELGAWRIRVNCVAPGLFDVAGTRSEIASISPEAMQEHLSGISLGRLGKANDLVGPIAFLLSDEAEYVTGQTISVDGGATMLG